MNYRDIQAEHAGEIAAIQAAAGYQPYRQRRGACEPGGQPPTAAGPAVHAPRPRKAVPQTEGPSVACVAR